MFVLLNTQWKSGESWMYVGLTLSGCIIVFWAWNAWNSKKPKPAARRRGKNVRQPDRVDLAPSPQWELKSENQHPYGGAIASKDQPKVADVIDTAEFEVAEDKKAGVFLLEDWWIPLIYQITHLFIVGGTNAGKTFTCKAILDGRIAAGHTIVIIDPHARKNRDKWGKWAEHCVGFGRNFTEIQSMLLALLQEMAERYDMDTNPVPVTVVIDETPAIVAKCPAWRSFITEWAFEARKTDLHLVVLTQSDRVESLGIQGKGDVRDSLSFLRLGAKVQHADISMMRRGGSFQSQEIENNAEKAIELEDISNIPAVEWNADSFWLPAQMPEVPSIPVPGIPSIMGVRSVAQLRGGETGVWAVAEPSSLIPAAIAALGQEYVQLYTLIHSSEKVSIKRLAAAVFPLELEKKAAPRIVKMKRDITKALTDASDEQVDGDQFQAPADSAVIQFRETPVHRDLVGLPIG